MPKDAAITKKGKRNLETTTDAYLWRILPPWSSPAWADGETWRRVVRNQPIAEICRETLKAYYLSLDWRIEARDSNQQDELGDEIKYYTKLFEKAPDGLEYSNHVELILNDVLDLPFGGASEVGREGDQPDGKVLWFDPIDGATLYPTPFPNYPVNQHLPGVPRVVQFPAHAINRIYLSPRSEFKYKGWGMAPPEKIYLAIQLLARGDVYFANLLLDTPQAGILDLLDMEKGTAQGWVESYRNFLDGIDPLKIPVLYEHEKPAVWIPFGRPPSEIMYDEITMKFAALTCAGYGLTLSDIGLSAVSSGEPLAGTIRNERVTRRKGPATINKKMVAYWNTFLPPTLKFSLIDYDDELQVSVGRARVANATAFGTLIDKMVLNPDEARLQIISDGLLSVPIPEKRPERDPNDQTPVAKNPMQKGDTPERPGLLGNPQPPSQGGYGEVKKSNGVSETAEAAMERIWKGQFDDLQDKASDVRIRKLVRKLAPDIMREITAVSKSVADDYNYTEWNKYCDEVLYGVGEAPEQIAKAHSFYFGDVDRVLDEDYWWHSTPDRDELIAILSAAYLYSLKSSARELIEDLYERGYIDSLDMARFGEFAIRDRGVLEYLESKAASMVKNVNEGTQYYLRRILVSSVRKGLSAPDIIAKIRAGVDIETIMDDNSFMQSLSSTVKAELAGMTDARIRSIVTYELETAKNQAWLDQSKKVGLTRKAWEHVGTDDPCEICKSNIALGFVPMDYQFDGTFGPTKTPPAHPHEHCGLVYDKQELSKVAQNINIFTG